MSKDTELLKDLCYLPSITDAILFSYKKTIGPIKTIHKQYSIDLLITASSIMKSIYIQYFKNFNKYDGEDISLIEISFSEKVYRYIEKNNNPKTVKRMISLINNTNYYYGLGCIKNIIEYSNKILDESLEYTIHDVR